MARRWTLREENNYKQELIHLYIQQNKSISAIAPLLGISYQTVYDRLIRLEIPISRQRKYGYNNQRRDIYIPSSRSEDLAEFFGIMLGDGDLSHTQTKVTLGSKEQEYATYVQLLMERLFRVTTHIQYTQRQI